MNPMTVATLTFAQQRAQPNNKQSPVAAFGSTLTHDQIPSTFAQAAGGANVQQRLEQNGYGDAKNALLYGEGACGPQNPHKVKNSARLMRACARPEAQNEVVCITREKSENVPT